MERMNRRTILATGAVALAGAASRSSIAEAQTPKPIFQVAEVTIPIVGEAGVFPVRRIYCIGRNYAAHAIERGSDPNREPPFFFQKPTDAIQNVPIGKVADHPYPSLTKNYHHEVELVAALKSGGTNIPPEKALDHVYGYALGLDMTRRDLQNQAKDMGRPWDMGKGFDQSAPIGLIYRAAEVGHPSAGEIKLEVSGKVKQHANLNELIWNVPETISYLSGLVTLGPGDLIYSGTPEGVGPVTAGDTLIGTVETCGVVAIAYV
jgi:2-keto-4-pentenoate hydratase/2-oxohepta-3-ene-1,7-dioic acid hydratase in catechol pathway